MTKPISSKNMIDKITLPVVLTLRDAQDVFQSLNTLDQAKELKLDWKDAKSIDIESYCMILHIKDVIREKGIAIWIRSSAST